MNQDQTHNQHSHSHSASTTGQGHGHSTSDNDNKHNVTSQTFTQAGPGSAQHGGGHHGTLGSGNDINTGATGGSGVGIGNISGDGHSSYPQSGNGSGQTGISSGGHSGGSTRTGAAQSGGTGGQTGFLGGDNYGQGGSAGVPSQQNNTGGPPGLQDILGENAAPQGGLAAQAAGGPGAPGQPGQVSGGVGSRYVPVSATLLRVFLIGTGTDISVDLRTQASRVVLMDPNRATAASNQDKEVLVSEVNKEESEVSQDLSDKADRGSSHARPEVSCSWKKKQSQEDMNSSPAFMVGVDIVISIDPDPLTYTLMTSYEL